MFPGLGSAWGAPSSRSDRGIRRSLIGHNVIFVAELSPAATDDGLPVFKDVDSASNARRVEYGGYGLSGHRNAGIDAMPGDTGVLGPS